MTKIVGFIAGPSAGKSTLALELAGWMKRERLNVEYVSEYPKDLAWENSTLFDDQLHILGEQWRRFYRLIGQVEWIVTDSPIISTLFYADGSLKKIGPGREAIIFLMKKIAIQCHHSVYHNLFFVERGNRKFIQAGRIHDEEESLRLDDHIKNTACDYNIDITSVKKLGDVLPYLGFQE
jgi:hypothetical protein